MLELKYDRNKPSINWQSTYNRTMLELKLHCPSGEMPKSELLLIPLNETVAFII